MRDKTAPKNPRKPIPKNKKAKINIDFIAPTATINGMRSKKFICKITIYCMLSYYAMLVFYPINYSFSEDNSNLRKKIYNELEVDRKKFQDNYKTYIPMDKAYYDCISIKAQDELCQQTVQDIRTRMSQIAQMAPTPLAPKELNLDNNENEQNIIIQDNRNLFLIRPTPYTTIITKPRNQYTPVPGFKPKNRFQNGDGFNQ
jgi:hypothetical protein